jgi:ABC-type uncharacterized transport system permease subunit
VNFTIIWFMSPCCVCTTLHTIALLHRISQPQQVEGKISFSSLHRLLSFFLHSSSLTHSQFYCVWKTLFMLFYDAIVEFFCPTTTATTIAICETEKVRVYEITVCSINLLLMFKQILSSLTYIYIFIYFMIILVFLCVLFALAWGALNVHKKKTC